MKKYITKFATTSEYEAAYSDGGLDLPNASLTEDNMVVHYNPYVHDYSQDYLTFVAKEAGTISFNILSSMGTDKIASISYSTDNGATWATTANQDDKSQNIVIEVNVNAGDTILWKGTATQTGYYDEDEKNYFGSSFSSTANFDVQGNVMSFIFGDDFKGKVDLTGKNYAFTSLFSSNSKLVSAENLSLPATTLAEECYSYMFNGCTSLTTAPELPATTLAYSCYDFMFSDCTSLTTAPELPATMLATYCYDSMFNGCTALTTAPELPATTLEEGCYSYMFNGCTSLTTAPELLATTLVDYCYASMFQGCSSLNYIKAMFTTPPNARRTNSWVSGVSSTGTFVKNSAAAWNVTGVNGVPNGWTVETASA